MSQIGKLINIQHTHVDRQRDSTITQQRCIAVRCEIGFVVVVECIGHFPKYSALIGKTTETLATA